MRQQKMPVTLSRQAGRAQEQGLPIGVMALLYAAVLYNACLALLHAGGVSQSFATVAATEAMILGSAIAYVLASDLQVVIRQPVYVVLLGFALTTYVSFAIQKIAVDCARNASIIGLFVVLGYQTEERQILGFFRWLSSLILVVLVFELVATERYAALFQPASYYAATRGIEEFSLDKSGLFRNALGFQGRFSFGLSTHRTASLFLEQVSLANFAGVLFVFLLSMFDRLKLADRILHVGLVLLILLTNDSRTSLSLAFASFLGYFIYPLLDLFLCLLIMPMIVATGYLFAHRMDGPVADDFGGRVSVTMQHLASFDLGTFLGFNARMLPAFMDSGYAYVIAGSTIFGLLLLWLFLSSVIPFDTASRKRCLFGLNIYIFSNLMIGGTAVFSIKVAAPLWFLVGFMGSRGCDRANAVTDRRSPVALADPALGV